MILQGSYHCSGFDGETSGRLHVGSRRIGENALRTILIILLLSSALLPTTARAPIDASKLQASQESTFDSWPTFHHDVARSGFSAGLAPGTPRVVWNYTVGGAVLSSPVIEDGVVYFGSTDGYFYALNQSSGGLIWRTRTGIIQYDSPAIYGRAVYVNAEGTLYGISASSGMILWSVNLGAQSAGSGLLVANGRIFVDMFHPGRLFSISPDNGSIIWTYNLTSAGDLAYSNGIIFQGGLSSGPAELDALSVTTGALVWSYSRINGIGGGPTVSNGILYAGGTPNGNYVQANITAFNMTTGTPLWQTPHIAWGPPAVA